MTSKGNSASYHSREPRRKLCRNELSDDAESAPSVSSNPHGFKISDWLSLYDEGHEALKPWEQGIEIATYEVRFALNLNTSHTTQLLDLRKALTSPSSLIDQQ